MRHDFPVELRTEDNFVLASARQGLLFVIARIPDPRFTHEVESRLMEHGGFVTLNIAPEKNCGPEDSLEGGDQTTVLGATLLHPERVEHLGAASEADRLALLPHGERCEEDRNQPVLPPGKAVGWMASDLEQKPAVTPRSPGPRGYPCIWHGLDCSAFSSSNPLQG